MNRPRPVSRRLLLSIASFIALVIGWAQPMPAAEAGFNSAAIASGSVGTHSLVAPVLDCDAGLLAPITLKWTQVSSAATRDPYSSPPNSSYLADGYEIYRATANGTYALLVSPDRAITSYSENPPGLLTQYHYKIRTTKGQWVSLFSNSVTGSSTSVFLGLLTTCAVD